MRTCSKCRQAKVDEEFRLISPWPLRRRGQCLDCERTAARARGAATRVADPDEQRRRVYGLTRAEMQSLGNHCHACGAEQPDGPNRTHRHHIDHCHETGQVRGLLCRPCNVALGYLKDSPARCLALANYIERTA